MEILVLDSDDFVPRQAGEGVIVAPPLPHGLFWHVCQLVFVSVDAYAGGFTSFVDIVSVFSGLQYPELFRNTEVTHFIPRRIFMSFPDN